MEDEFNRREFLKIGRATPLGVGLASWIASDYTSGFLRAALAQDAVPGLAIIPLPASTETRDGTFHVRKTAEVLVEGNGAEIGRIANELASVLSGAAGRTVAVRDAKGGGRAGRIVMSLAPDSPLGPEGYDLSIEPESVLLRAATAAGLFYGVQTIDQMLSPGAGTERTAAVIGPKSLPCMRIHDQPRFRWRGLMLDCSRTFLTVDYLKRSVDRMALYKLNVLHLHLTDDQGWRLEIKKYPKLTTMGSRFDAKFGGGGGYYTQEEMRNLVQYARDRNVTIVPEIEFPGHSVEVLAAYPELACPIPNRPPREVAPYWEMEKGMAAFRANHGHTDPLCAGNDLMFQMYQDIFSEVISLFPSEFIHLGGDEVPKEAWNQCPRCQARIQKEGLKDEEGLQSYAIKRIVEFIADKGRRAIGWDEILEGGLAPGAAVMSWRGTQGGLAAAQQGHDVVMTPGSNCYLDSSVIRRPTDVFYSYEPVPKELSGNLTPHIIGVQGSMWTHIAIDEKSIDFQTYPRLLALAEVGWSPIARNWPDFQRRLQSQMKRLQLLGVQCFDAASLSREKKIGGWQASEVEGDSPHVLEWDTTSLMRKPGQYEVHIRREAGQKRVFVQSIVLLEDGREIGRETLVGPLHDFAFGWVELDKPRPGAHYTIRLGMWGDLKNDIVGSVSLVEPAR